MKKCRNHLQAIRNAKGYTLAQLSDATGVPVSTIGNFENMKRGINDGALDAIVDFLQVCVGDVLMAGENGIDDQEDGFSTLSDRLDSLEQEVRGELANLRTDLRLIKELLLKREVNHEQADCGASA